MSGANEYTVKPFAFVTTFVPLIVVVFRAVPEAAAEEAAALGELLAALGVLGVPDVPRGPARRGGQGDAGQASRDKPSVTHDIPPPSEEGRVIPQHVPGRASVQWPAPRITGGLDRAPDVQPRRLPSAWLISAAGY